MKPIQHAIALISLSLAAMSVQAAQITALSPQGEIAQVRQVAVKFDEAMVPMGDSNATAPLTLVCDPAAVLESGQGRWVDEKNWVFDFKSDLPPGVKCTAKIAEDLQSVAGNAYSGQIHYNFNTGGPFVKTIRPWEGNTIAEDQAFILRLNGDATAQTISQYVWCESSAVGEQIPVNIIEGDERTKILTHFGWGKEATEHPAQYWVLQCQQRLSPNTAFKLVYGQGVATPTNITNNIQKVFNYTVREEFKANFSCVRENAQAACMPLESMRLNFNAMLPLALAEQIVLKGSNGQTYQPIISDNDRQSGLVYGLSFPKPLPEESTFQVVLPADIQDDSGRKLANADQFPLNVATAEMPPLAKFAAAPFGIVELYGTPDAPPMVPLTVRRVENTLDVLAQSMPANRGTVSNVRLTSDKEIIRWLRAVDIFNRGWIDRSEATNLMPQAQIPSRVNPDNGRAESWVPTREISLLAEINSAKPIELPQEGDGQGATRPFEVIGIPLTEPGYHVLEVASPALGDALLEPEYGQRNMYVRTGVLVTNLAVHAKIGRENSLVWVTTLNEGKPVPDAEVRILGCNGTEYFSGKTDAQGIVNIDEQLPDGTCPGRRNWEKFLFISARAADEKAPGGMDMAFTLSTWDRGIEYWRFSYPTNFSPKASSVATTVFDRTLLRAGETVSMKHFIRDLNLGGFALPEGRLPDIVKIIHQGSGQETTLPLTWERTGGGLSASSVFEIPATAKLGNYTITLARKSGGDSYDRYYTGGFQVEEFRLPVFEGSISVNTQGDSKALVQPKDVPLGLQINYLSGGGAAQLPVQISAVVRETGISFRDYDRRFSFNPPPTGPYPSRSYGDEDYDDDYSDEAASSSATGQKLIADKLPLTLDRNGSGQITLAQIPVVTRAQDLLVEASFADPNGEIVTLRRNETLWPAAVVAGIRNDNWVAVKNSNVTLQAIALSTDGKPQAGVPMEIRAQQRLITSTRKRLVGGFYTYDSHTEIKDLGTICSGTSDEQGLLTCTHKFGPTPEQLAACAEASTTSGVTVSVCQATEGGQIELVAVAKDEAGRTAQAFTSLWVLSRDELWFGGSDSDRIDLLPEQPEYRPGDTARFQLRMPFRDATALVTVEREGVIESHVVPVSGSNPTIELKVGEHWGPNVYISALVLRGRLHEVPLYSFFTWGYKNTDQWWNDFQNNADYAPPTALVDLSKPAYRLGVAEIRVIDPAYQLNVQVATDQPSYQVRSTAKATITITLPDGTPAAHADVALAVVDEALLELKKNQSWDLLSAMLTRRSWGVRTATAQMEIIGRRHYGRKALPAGGGGGNGGASARELFDTLLVWNPSVELDANGQATIDIPLNDSLTTFRVVAIAADGSSRFGSGSAKFRSTQDLQLISGLPPVVRSDDSYRAGITVRNATEQPMKVDVSATATGLTLEPITLEIPANSAREAVWEVTVPAELAGMYQGQMAWEISAKDTSTEKGATDAIKVSQRILTGVPITVRQATLKQLDGTLELPVAPPSDGLPGRGGIQISMVPRLAEGLPAITDWLNRYPYICLEQRVSVELGTRDTAGWKALAARIPSYLDEDGLAYYYPPSGSISRRGSDILTAYILSSADEASKLNAELALPAEVSKPMLAGLAKFAEGKLQRDYWSPRKDLDMRRLAAMEALSRYNQFHPRMLSTITLAPNQWPTTSVIQWLQILQRTPSIANRDERMAEAQQILRSRLNVAGTRLGFSTEENDYWWWLMWNSDLNAAYLLLATLNDDGWQEDLPKLVTGFIARQQNGAWHTTTANLWGSFALEQFSRKFEHQPVHGLTQIRMVDADGKTTGSGTVDWKLVHRITDNAIGTHAPGTNVAFGAPSAAASFANNSVFMAWPTPPQQSTVILNQDGSGKPWATIQSLAAVPLKAPFSAGYSITKTVTPIDEQVKGEVSRGDIWRVRIEVNAQTDMTWVVVNDPIPGGATILGSGLGRDSEIATSTPTPASDSNTGNNWRAWLAYQERAQDGFRAYYQFVPKGTFSIEYTVRLNNVGTFILPPTRVEAMYAPEMFGESPNASVTIKPAPAAGH
ncbi:putative lipoprotein YfhM [Saezia sanguinis]|uniref:Putative lipoprotein YfhM n=1 Tax=Saezia sanguinis TaxID=1965230 RepID=A0A433SBK8_9BURK|nr:Ig-like domain-containing alpha-2-macroglobulin family protein [Saezia sanguinis]RUS66034.1 putative lipoprotein YfhM [Saezia sanguinis]